MQKKKNRKRLSKRNLGWRYRRREHESSKKVWNIEEEFCLYHHGGGNLSSSGGLRWEKVWQGGDSERSIYSGDEKKSELK